MREKIAVSLLCVGVILALYIGIGVMFIGGIVGLIKVVKAVDTPTGLVALNILKIVLAGPVTHVIFIIFAGITKAIKGKKKE